MPRTPACRFYARGCCNRGSECQFRHDPLEDQVCQFFLRGACAFGENCDFRHPSSYGTEPAVLAQFEQPRYEDPVGHTAHTVDFEEWEQNGNSSQAISKADVSDAQETDSASCSDKVENLLVEDFAEALDIGSAAFQDRIVSNTCSDNTPPPDADSFLSEASEQEDIGDGPYNHEEWERLMKKKGYVDFKGMPICQAWRQNKSCPYWKSCEHVHGHRCETCSQWCVHSYDRAMANAHRRECSARMLREVSRIDTEERECAICLERISGKMAAHRKFGLLNCEHCFCLDCVRSWRAMKDSSTEHDSAVRSCPVCRQVTDYVTPSRVWPRSEEEKEEIMKGYRSRLKTLQCRYWIRSPENDRSCPFGTSCFYHHPGQKKQKLRYLHTAENEIKIAGAVYLSEFLR